MNKTLGRKRIYEIKEGSRSDFGELLPPGRYEGEETRLISTLGGHTRENRHSSFRLLINGNWIMVSKAVSAGTIVVV